jgi:glucoamylase
MMEPATVRWTFDNWHSSEDSNSNDSGWNLHHVDLPTEALPTDREIVFTFYWRNAARWEGRDYQVTVE